MAGTYGESGATYGELGGTYGNLVLGPNTTPPLTTPTFTVRKGATRTRGSYNRTMSSPGGPTRTRRV